MSDRVDVDELKEEEQVLPLASSGLGKRLVAIVDLACGVVQYEVDVPDVGTRVFPDLEAAVDVYNSIDEGE